MGYDVHISRRENWFDDHGPVITMSEFESAVARDPDLVMVPMPDGWQRGPQSVAQLAGDAQRQESALHWSEGRIVSKHPSSVVIAKMCQLARELGARVQGDDGEFYDGDEHKGRKTGQPR